MTKAKRGRPAKKIVQRAYELSDLVNAPDGDNITVRIHYTRDGKEGSYTLKELEDRLSPIPHLTYTLDQQAQNFLFRCRISQFNPFTGIMEAVYREDSGNLCQPLATIIKCARQVAGTLQ